MALSIPPPPTYAQLVLPGAGGKLEDATFNPIWLSWFIELVAVVTQTSGGGGISHDLLVGLQGGTTNQFYHLSFFYYTRVIGNFTTAPSSISVGSSPFNYQNASSTYDESVIVKGGTVSKIEFSRDNSTFYDVGVTAGMFTLNPADSLKVSYSVAPTMTSIPR